MLREFVSSVAVAAIVATPGVAIAAPTTFTLGGTWQLTDTGQPVPPLNLVGVLGGRYDDGPAVSVPFPATVIGMDRSVALGAEHLVAQLQSTTGERRALGLSQGAIAVAEAKRRLMALPADQRPDPGTLTFVAVADPTRPGHGALTQMGYQTPDTPYDTAYFTREYDGFADLPDRFNVLALVNAAAGIVYLHPFYGELPADIPAKNVTTTVNGAGGAVTDVLIPTPHLPMLQPLRNLGMNVDRLEATLRPMVDAGYSRNDVEPAAASGTKADASNVIRKTNRQRSRTATCRPPTPPTRSRTRSLPHRTTRRPGTARRRLRRRPRRRRTNRPPVPTPTTPKAPTPLRGSREDWCADPRWRLERST
ncbi:PE-PPE domain-containing protein [Mycobacterium hodleri]|uniref:PE-PPE domain-containing protein n=1 Tax=Mycolicibacterium hodleri TaxID=49897 RepID=UPI0021F38A28|nr:PE-PPE domain-containing protein [Mycolicibacterium hodleri]MCV7135582.1 PE-PPE domain-containing protein [Mycolicibacterium hodleri]